ncbi:MAG: deoxyribose-phosphate aldolase [Bifidobacteriaceae bacterium]|jgi:deoxyribose-phosphate aldolase|nr:deoxyribose-phosphate aldolase [Bifidobacteriaceae bacterium]
MENKLIYKYIDHTLLKPTSSWIDISQICQQALDYKTASACIPPIYVEKAHKTFPELNICTVIGFPLGYTYSDIKTYEAQEALAKGANEIDMVTNIAEIKNLDWDKVLADIVAVRQVTQGHILKVIIETAYLNKVEKIKMCQLITQAKADYIKTSTGFASSGATPADIELFSKYIGSRVRMKAAGGVKTKSDIEKYIALGVDRIGTSSAIEILAGQTAKGY